MRKRLPQSTRVAIISDANHYEGYPHVRERTLLGLGAPSREPGEVIFFLRSVLRHEKHGDAFYLYEVIAALIAERRLHRTRKIARRFAPASLQQAAQ